MSEIGTALVIRHLKRKKDAKTFWKGSHVSTKAGNKARWCLSSPFINGDCCTGRPRRALRAPCPNFFWGPNVFTLKFVAFVWSWRPWLKRKRRACSYMWARELESPQFAEIIKEPASFELEKLHWGKATQESTDTWKFDRPLLLSRSRVWEFFTQIFQRFSTFVLMHVHNPGFFLCATHQMWVNFRLLVDHNNCEFLFLLKIFLPNGDPPNPNLTQEPILLF